MPSFSIIIPVYNVEKYIKECLESIVNQTFTDFEAIFVDDCGSDNSIKIVEEYAQRDNRIKILYNESNKGISASRNAALDFATGEYTTCLDPDDWLELNALEVIYNAFKKYNVNSIWFDANRYYDNSKVFDEEPVIHCKEGWLNVQPNYICYYTEFSWGKAYKTKSIKDYKIDWPLGINYGEDAAFYYKYYTYNPYCWIIEDRLYNYRMRESSAVRNAQEGRLNLEDMYDSIKILNNFYKQTDFLNEYNITILKFLRKSIANVTFNHNRYEETLSKNDLIMKEVDFPNSFKEFDYKLNPLISVVLHINDFNNLKNLIESIKYQTHKNIEIVFLVNCLDNKTRSKLNSLTKSCKKIKFITYDTEQNTEPINLTDINGDFIIFANKNSVFKDNAIERLIDKIKETNQSIIFYMPDSPNSNHQTKTEYKKLDNEIYSSVKKGELLPIIKRHILKENNYIFNINLLKKQNYTYLIDDDLYCN